MAQVGHRCGRGRCVPSPEIRARRPLVTERHDRLRGSRARRTAAPDEAVRLQLERRLAAGEIGPVHGVGSRKNRRRRESRRAACDLRKPADAGASASRPTPCRSTCILRNSSHEQTFYRRDRVRRDLWRQCACPRVVQVRPRARIGRPPVIANSTALRPAFRSSGNANNQKLARASSNVNSTSRAPGTRRPACVSRYSAKTTYGSRWLRETRSAARAGAARLCGIRTRPSARLELTYWLRDEGRVAGAEGPISS